MGFIIAALLLLAMKRVWFGSKDHKTRKSACWWTAEASTVLGRHTDLLRHGVSFVRGSNDGQKGIGLVMLVLICMAPAYFALDMNSRSYDLDRTQDANQRIMEIYQRNQDQGLPIWCHQCPLPKPRKS